MDILVGSAAAVAFELQGPTGPLVPDIDSASYRVFDQSGSLLSGPITLITTDVTSRIVIPTAGAGNTITAPRQFEKRTVQLDWASDGRAYTLRQFYRIIPFVNMTASVSDVRALLGLSEDELADDEIDLFSAYLWVDTSTPLASALASGTRLELSANRAIVCQAALRSVITLELRAAHAVEDGTQKFERFSKIDFNEIRRNIQAELSSAMTLLSGGAVPLPTLVALVLPVDPVTGS